VRRKAPKAPLAVAAILAMPLSFMALMALTLAVEKPAVTQLGKLAKPSGTTEAEIWLLTAAFPFALIVLGVAAMRMGRFGVIVSGLAAIAAAVALLIPLDTWTTRHTARYPDGVDLIPHESTSDIYLRGEWEGMARHTAVQLGIVTIVLAGLAVGLLALIEVRRRRRPVAPVPPPPPEVVTGGPNIAQP
jgi:hypothetical protein